MKRPGYTKESAFVSQLVRTLCHAYDFRDLRNINNPISQKAIYNQAIDIWNTLNNPDTI